MKSLGAGAAAGAPVSVFSTDIRRHVANRAHATQTRFSAMGAPQGGVEVVLVPRNRSRSLRFSLNLLGKENEERLRATRTIENDFARPETPMTSGTAGAIDALSVGPPAPTEGTAWLNIIEISS